MRIEIFVIIVMVVLGTTLALAPLYSPGAKLTIEQGLPSLIDVPRETLIQDAQLIIQGRVVDQDQVKTKFGPMTENTIRIENVTRGHYNDRTIKVLDSENLNRGDRAQLFLYKSPMFGGAWSIIGLEQGTYPMNDDTVRGKFLPKDGIDVKTFRQKFLGLQFRADRR